MRRLAPSAAALLLAAAIARPSIAQQPAAPPDALAPLDFEQAVARALARNPTVTVAVEEIRRARALVDETRAASLPTLSAGGSYTRLDNDRRVNGVTILSADEVALNLTLAVPIVAPRAWTQWSHAKDNVDVSRLSAVEVQRQLAVSVARTYLSTVAQHRVIEVGERALEAARAHLDFANQRYAGGYGTRVDVVRAAQEVAGDRAQVEAAHAQLTRLREALGVLLGASGEIEVATDVVLPSAPPPADAAREAVSTRSDVRLYRLRVDTAHHLVRDDWADYVPYLSGTFQPFYQSPPTQTLPETGWQAQLLLTIPLYDGGLRYGLAGERRALENQARAVLEGGVRQAESDVRASYEEVKRADTALIAAREAAQLAHEAVSLTTLAYKAGASTNIEVIDAERQARDADTAVAIGEDASRQALLDVLIASGRFPAQRVRLP